MKRVIAITAALLVATAHVAIAQSTPQTLAQIAAAEEARRKNAKKATKVYTNSTLTPDPNSASPGAPTVPGANASPSNLTPDNATPAAPIAGATPGVTPGGTAAPVNPNDQKFWADRMAKARQDLSRAQIFADSLQSRINGLTTEYVNRDDPAQRAQVERTKNESLAELERVKKELEQYRKAITAIEDEARKAGIPSGWLR